MFLKRLNITKEYLTKNHYILYHNDKEAISGCNANAILNKEEDNNMSCYIQKGIKDYMLSKKENIDVMDPHYTRILNKNQRK